MNQPFECNSKKIVLVLLFVWCMNGVCHFEELIVFFKCSFFSFHFGSILHDFVRACVSNNRHFLMSKQQTLLTLVHAMFNLLSTLIFGPAKKCIKKPKSWNVFHIESYRIATNINKEEKANRKGQKMLCFVFALSVLKTFWPLSSWFKCQTRIASAFYSLYHIPKPTSIDVMSCFRFVFFSFNFLAFIYCVTSQIIDFGCCENVEFIILQKC